MIFVTTGVTYGFERLVTRMDEIAGKMSEPVVMQIGETEYEPKHARYFKFISRDAMEELYRNARIIVGHAGVGTITKALEYNKPMILVPRLKKYKEHINDHQLEIAEELEKEGTTTVVYNIEDLESALKTVNVTNTYKIENMLVESLKRYLDQISPGKKI